MNELKPEDVMKALECCARTKWTKCDQCPRKDEDALCMYRLCEDALALLCEKDEEIERLTEENDGWEATNKILTTNNADLEAELALTYDLLEESKSDTVRKMHSEIKERCIKGGIYPAFVASTIDQIAKEMVEGK